MIFRSRSPGRSLGAFGSICNKNKKYFYRHQDVLQMAPDHFFWWLLLIGDSKNKKSRPSDQWSHAINSLEPKTISHFWSKVGVHIPAWDRGSVYVTLCGMRKICVKNIGFRYLVFLNCSHDFLSMIFGFSMKFHVDIGGRKFFSENFSKKIDRKVAKQYFSENVWKCSEIL